VRVAALALLIGVAHGAQPARAGAATRQGVTNTAPSSPPLTTAGGGAGAGGEEDAGNTPQAETDPLVSNGLGSPTCKGALARELSSTGRRNCETSGFVAAAAPTGDFGIDVHIDTGVLGLSSGGLLSTVQALFVTPVWMALVWVVHALVVMLEWCFTIDLLDSAAAAGVGGPLRQMQAAVTEPWLPIALASASVLVLYHGLIRRRVAETLGEVVVMVAMMAAGIWVIADPTATVGALGAWANQASLGTLAVAAHGTPSGPRQAFGASLGAIFDAAIEVPWCYLEFGNVGWCREPSRLDPALRAAALKIAAQEIGEAACQSIPAAEGLCLPHSVQALEHSTELLRDAQSNGALFLALPANGPARNSINEQGSLLRTLCQSSEATNCRGPTAAEAEFRTNSGTWPRVAGLVLIVGGLLGMLLLLGFVAVRLLAAAIFSLLYLLLAPAMVLAPAFGQAGRALFRRWAVQLLGAVVSKLVFSFLLGVILAVLAILSNLEALGWWTQWLLMSAFWWGAYLRRHQLFGATGVPPTQAGSVGMRNPRRSIARGMSEALAAPRTGIAVARWAKGRLSGQAPDGQGRKLARVGRQRARAGADEQVVRSLEAEHRAATQRAAAAPQIQARMAAGGARLQRLDRERGDALAAGDTRRATELGHRADRVRDEIEGEQETLGTAQRLAREGQQAHRRTGDVSTRERRDEQSRFLDAQAALPAGGRAHASGARRDYAALAGLAGYGRAEYARLAPGGQRAARLEIDRELALRSELRDTADTLASDVDGGRIGRRERRQADRRFDSTLQRRMKDAGHTLPASRRERSSLDDWQQAGRAKRSGASGARGDRGDRSSVMRDAHEVAARRKRQLGRDRT
jgi:hypothetical protein